MKIAVWHNLPSGGAKRALYDQVKGLLARGHEIEAWCPATADKSYLPLTELIPEHDVPLEVESRSVKASRQFRFSPYAAGSVYRQMEQHCRVCADEISSGGFDLLFGNACENYRVSPVARFVDIPSVIYLGEPNRWYYESLPELPWLAPEIDGSLLNPATAVRVTRELMANRHIRILARQELLSARAYDLILTNSLYSRESILKAYGIDSRVCYLGIDAELFSMADCEKQNVIVGVGSFDRIKNIEFVIQAVSLLNDFRPKLIWIGNSGEPAYQEELVALAGKLRVDYESRLMIPDSELVDIMNSACVMAYAPRLEPFGLTPLEANCCGLPVVGVAEAGVRESISHGNNGVLVEAEPQAMADALGRFLANLDAAAAFGKKARDWVIENWSMDRSIDTLEQYFLKTAGRGAQ